MSRSRFLPDNFTLALIASIIIASLLPASGKAAEYVEWTTTAIVSLLFFLHGAKLSRQAIVAGIGHWRLHVCIFIATFVMFPILGLALRPLLSPLVTTEMYVGVIFLCTLPATVQSAIAFTSIARGNVPAAICSASASTLLGILVTPILVSLLLNKNAEGGDALRAVGKIAMTLLLPFVIGHLLRPLMAGFLQRRSAIIKLVDQGSILFVVYAAFSAAVISGLWKQTPIPALIGLIVLCCALLAVVLAITTFGARHLGFNKEDEITLVFCGSKKSMVSGIPMANVLFPAASVGAIVLPLMLFHQIQLMVCAALAQRYAQRPQSAEDSTTH
ncbi:bile acid:sodium symporter [Comamonas sp. Y33R10-2]|uniref:bile acid:sodium symporter family protein n=1 Tax=Comamonas sp. Y33R10-2 TaxID=2853257 RepID=UPI001C5CB2BC|nr:bile acid:sodium symporter family protein [Comamonas sp. Y33R10-2]QXZ10627.1 bile acid:sodium symporter [Comamonas sp. Y33R10-2]